MSNYTTSLLSEIKIRDASEWNAPYAPAIPVNFTLKHYDSRIYPPSNDPHLIGRRSSKVFFNPHDEERLQNAQVDLYFFLDLDNATSLEVIRKLETHIALNPKHTRLEVTIIRSILVLDQESEALSWLMELANVSDTSTLKRIRVQDMDFKDDEEYCCSICLDNLAEQKVLPLPVTLRMRWNHIFSVCKEYFTGRKDTRLACMPCNHVFHNHCIVKWLNASSSCPVCRFDLNKPKRF